MAKVRTSEWVSIGHPDKMKKQAVIVGTIALATLSFSAFAGPYGYRHHCGSGWCYSNPGWRRDGLGTAAAITSIVADGVSIVSNIANTSRYYSQPVYIQTPVYQTPVYRPVYTPPPVVRPAASPAVKYVVPVYQTPVYTRPPVVVPVMPPAATYRSW